MSTETPETKPYMVTLTGPSGSGKTTILNKLVESGKFISLISTTTRPPRAGEIDDVDYHFVDRDTFERDLRRGSFAQYVDFRDNYYGTNIYDVRTAFNSGSIPICIVEPSGVEQFRKIGSELNFEVVPVFITASGETLVERYLGRVVDDALRDEEEGDSRYDSVSYHAKRLVKILDEFRGWGHGLDGNLYNITYQNEASGTGPKSIPHLIDALTTRRFNVYDFVSHRNNLTRLEPNVS